MRTPYVFDEFFASGREETVSPFLTPISRKWAKNISLKGAILAACLLVISFALYFINLDAYYLTLTAVYFLVGTPACINAIEDLLKLEINIDVLMTLAALLSIVIGSGLEGALLLVLFELSGAMENAVTHKTKGALMELQSLTPKMAHIFTEEGTLIERSIKEISLGTTIFVKAGELVPLDGEVISGSSFVNLVHLTGESQPLSKRKGDTVQAGAHNLDGSLTLSVTRTSADSTLSRIITLITEAQGSKPKLQRLFDRFGKAYSIAIIAISFAFGLSLPLFTSIPYLGLEGSIYRALAFLIAASPCALIIATPTAYLSAISSCARKGILLKGGAILDGIASCKIIAFDKTGTLTSGRLTCTGIESIHEVDYPEKTALSAAAGLEQHAVHPIGDAIVRHSQKKNLPPLTIDQFQSVPGYGLKGTIEIEGVPTPIRIGHPDFIDEVLPRGSWEDALPPYEKQSTLLLLGTSLYHFHFTDEIRPESHTVLPALHKRQGIDLALLTGDHTENAQIVGKELGISAVYSNLRPEDKLEKVASLSKEHGLIMVGDGVNDAPALARSTVGISMGKIGSATAVDASDVVFLNDDLSLMDWLLGKSKKTMRIVRENLILALAVICLATTPALLGWIPLWLAVILHEGGTVIVGLNSLRLLK